MKKISFLLGAFLLTLSSFAQNVVTENNGRVTVRNANDSILTQIDPVGSGAVDASFNPDKSEIIVIYSNGYVFIKKADGTIIGNIMEPCADNVATAVWSGDHNIIVTTLSQQTLIKDAREWRQ